MTEAEKAEFSHRFQIMAGNIGNYSSESPIYRRQREITEREQKLPVNPHDVELNTQLREIRQYLEAIDPYLVSGLKMLGNWAWPDRNWTFYKSGLGRVVEGEAPVEKLFAGTSPLILARKSDGVFTSFNYNIRNVSSGYRFYHYYPLFVDFRDGNPISIGYNHSGFDKGVKDLTNHSRDFTVDEMIRFFSMYFDNPPKTAKVRS